MSFFSNFIDRVEMLSLLSQHLSTFSHYEKKKFYNKTEIPFSDFVLFLIIPILLSIAFAALGFRFNGNYVNIALTCLSIFIGLLFGLLTMIFSLLQGYQNVDNKKNKKEIGNNRKYIARVDLTKYLFINIAFAIALSIFSLIAVLTTQFYPPKVIEYLKGFELYFLLSEICLYVSNGIAFFFLIEFVLVLFMIVKRFTVLFLTQFSEANIEE